MWDDTLLTCDDNNNLSMYVGVFIFLKQWHSIYLVWNNMALL